MFCAQRKQVGSHRSTEYNRLYVIKGPIFKMMAQVLGIKANHHVRHHARFHHCCERVICAQNQRMSFEFSQLRNVLIQ